jgi:hypothetical protein
VISNALEQDGLNFTSGPETLIKEKLLLKISEHNFIFFQVGEIVSKTIASKTISYLFFPLFILVLGSPGYHVLLEQN